MISNKYYVTTIIAIFLSLSIGILIGGTLGQQWINFNQQKLITYYEEKSKELEKINKVLKTENEKTFKNYWETKSELYTLYTRSISNLLKDKEFLFIVDSQLNDTFIRDAIVLAGGNVSEVESTLVRGIDINYYDLIILNTDKQEKNSKYDWLNQYQKPVIYLNNNQEILLNEREKQFIKKGTYNENYRFIYYLRNMLQEHEVK